jgi:hypothetical protein
VYVTLRDVRCIELTCGGPPICERIRPSEPETHLVAFRRALWGKGQAATTAPEAHEHEIRESIEIDEKGNLVVANEQVGEFVSQASWLDPASE